jgi:hypothetical protein
MIPLIAIGVPVCVAFTLSVASLIEERTVWSFVQLLGAFCFMIVVFAHVAEAFGLFPRMGWGLPDSAGHNVDFVHIAHYIRHVVRSEHNYVLVLPVCHAPNPKATPFPWDSLRDRLP